MKRKNCKICEAELNNDNHSAYAKSRYINKCKVCLRKEKLDWQRQHSDKSKRRENALKSNHSLKEKDPLKYSCKQMAGSARKRAIKFNLPYEINTLFLTSIATEFCPILGVKLKYGGGKISSESASLDRVVPELGYVEGNVQIISNLANMMKSSANKEQLLKFADWVYRQEGLNNGNG